MESEVNIVRVPKLYENMDEATIGSWLVSEGDELELGTELLEFVTDKTTELYPSPFSGTVLKIYCKEKSTVPISFGIAAIGPPGAIIPDVSQENEAILNAANPLQDIKVDFSRDKAVGSSPVESSSRRPRIAPAARAFAKKNGLDLDQISI